MASRQELEELRRLDELEEKARKSRIASNPGEYDPNSPEFKARYGPLSEGRTRQVAVRGKGVVTEPEDDTFTEGIGSGMTRMTKGILNVASKGSPVVRNVLKVAAPNFASDKALRTQDEIDAPLGETGKGMAGQIVGQTAATLPLNLATGGLSSAAAGPSTLGRLAGSAPVRAALEGIVPAAAMADPDKQAEGGTAGAAVSAILDTFFRGSGRMVKGVVQKSQAVKDLIDLIKQHGEDIFVPLSQAAGDQDVFTRVAKTGYQEGLSLIPGVKGQLTRQARDAEAKVREVALREASPTGTSLPAKPGENVGEAVHSIEDTFDRDYRNTVKSYAFNIPDTLADDVAAKIKKSIPNIDDTTLAKAVAAVQGNLSRFSSGKNTIDGENILNAKNVLTRAAARSSPEEKAAMKIAQEHIDDLIKDQLSQGNAPSNIADLNKYLDLDEPSRQFKGLKAAAEAAKSKGGNFSMTQLANESTDPTQLHLASTAGDVLNQPASGSSFAGRTMAGIGLGLAAGAGAVGVPGTLPAAMLTVAGGNAMATKTAQKALMGDLQAQQMLARILRKYPKQTGVAGRLTRQAAAAQAGDSYGP